MSVQQHLWVGSGGGWWGTELKSPGEVGGGQEKRGWGQGSLGEGNITKNGRNSQGPQSPPLRGSRPTEGPTEGLLL